MTGHETNTSSLSPGGVDFIDAPTQFASGGHYKDQLLQALEVFQEMLIPGSACAWKKQSDKNGIHFFTGQAPNGNTKALTSRIQIHIDVPPRIVFEVMRHRVYRTMTDSMMKSIIQVEEVDFQTAVVHLTYKGVWPVSSRDFVLATNWKIAKDGTIWMTTCSVKHKQVPGVKKVIRGDMMIGGYTLRPRKSADGSITTEVEYAGSLDMGGNILKKVRETANRVKSRSSHNVLKRICENLAPREVAAYAKYMTFAEQLAARKASGNPEGKEIPASSINFNSTHNTSVMHTDADITENIKRPT